MANISVETPPMLRLADHRPAPHPALNYLKVASVIATLVGGGVTLILSEYFGAAVNIAASRGVPVVTVLREMEDVGAALEWWLINKWWIELVALLAPISVMYWYLHSRERDWENALADVNSLAQEQHRIAVLKSATAERAGLEQEYGDRLSAANKELDGLRTHAMHTKPTPDAHSAEYLRQNADEERVASVQAIVRDSMLEGRQLQELRTLDQRRFHNWQARVGKLLNQALRRRNVQESVAALTTHNSEIPLSDRAGRICNTLEHFQSQLTILDIAPGFKPESTSWHDIKVPDNESELLPLYAYVGRMFPCLSADDAKNNRFGFSMNIFNASDVAVRIVAKRLELQLKDRELPRVLIEGADKPIPPRQDCTIYVYALTVGEAGAALRAAVEAGEPIEFNLKRLKLEATDGTRAVPIHWLPSALRFTRGGLSWGIGLVAEISAS
jgi:hypothetical protein